MKCPQFRDYKIIFHILAIAQVLSACSGIERTENEKVRRRNCKGEYICRSHTDYFCPIGSPAQLPKSPYPWDGNLPRITKDFFRCKGSAANPALMDASQTAYMDCEGCTRHGLPILRNKETVYPILLDLLNHLQQRTGKRVVITCGHRCPTHNTYSDPSSENKLSKHQIGAEVDFYVQGMEDAPESVVALLIEYYQQTPSYRGQKEYEVFQRYEKGDANVSTKPWFNKEIFIKLHLPSEGRDRDNIHPYPYLTIQVRYDREAKEKVTYDWKRANLGYPRG